MDTKNDNTLWAYAIAKELKNVKVEFEILPNGSKAHIGHQQVKYHMVLNIKMEDFRCTVSLVAGGHMTKKPSMITYASVCCETVRTAFLIVALNDIEVKSEDILNAYAKAPVTEKV